MIKYSLVEFLDIAHSLKDLLQKKLTESVST